MSPPSHPELDEPADEYLAAVNYRLALQSEEKTKKAELLEKLKSFGLTTYETPNGTIIERNAEESLKARKKKEPKADTEESEDEFREE